MRKIGFPVFVAIAISMGLSACASGISESDQILAFAKDTYFGGPNDQHIPGERVLIRWNRPLQVSLEGRDADRYRDRVVGYLANFTKSSGLRAGLVEAPEEANLAVLLSDKDATYPINGGRTRCYTNIQNKGGSIGRVEIRIGVTDTAQVERCLAHELYHAFGLRYHSVAAASVLSSVHGQNRPTSADELALSILYDPRLLPGSAPHEAAAALREITAQVKGDFGKYWLAVLPSESRIQVRHNSARNYVSRYVRSQSPLKNSTTEIAYWKGSEMFQPVAVVTLVTADLNYFIDNIPSFESHMTQMIRFNQTPVVFSEQKKRKGRYGLVDTVDLRIDNIECLGFRQRIGNRNNTGMSTDLVIGFFCANPGVPVDMQIVGELLQDLQIRGVY